MDELARWVQVSAQAEGVEPLKAENYARQAARLFMQEILTPRPRADNPDFSNRLTKAWLTQAGDATAAARMLRWLEYPVLLTAAAAAAGAIFGLTGHEVLQIAAAVGAGGIAVTGGVAGYQRDRDPDTKAKSEAEFVELLGLLEQISAFVVDLVRVPFTEMPAPRPAIHQGLSAALAMPADGEDIALPKGLVVLPPDSRTGHRHSSVGTTPAVLSVTRGPRAPTVHPSRTRYPALGLRGTTAALASAASLATLAGPV